MLKVESISAGYGTFQVLFGMSLNVGAGEMVSLMGRNGMGKTTTVRAIMGLTRLSAGSITFNGTETSGLPPFRIARMGIGLVPEGRQVFPTLTVKENLVATAARTVQGPMRWHLDDIFTLFPGLANRLGHYGNQLSGGEQQMVAIGRALMTNPALLILDEATEGLAPLIREQIWKSLLRLKGSGLSILVIDKDIHSLSQICDRHVIIEKGRVVWEGAAADLDDDPNVCHRHLGIG
ncbi:MAG: ABC transporter ATP-binding protein [Pseudomonadota bacterium]